MNMMYSGTSFIIVLGMNKSWLAEAYSRISLRRVTKALPEQILLLLPRCLQNSDCSEKVSRSIHECKYCGKCDLGAIADLQKKYGFLTLIASGGRQAVAAARAPNIKVIIAVACPKELMLGILGVFPKPVVGVYNQQSNGPCINTRVCAGLLEETLQKVMKHE